MRHSLRANPDLSQNFLHDPRLVARLVEQSSIGGSDLVIEIGPGRGIITEELARRAGRVIAVEKDPDLVRELRRNFVGCANVQIRHGDFLDYPLPRGRYKVFANIPFNVTFAIVKKLMRAPVTPSDAYLVVQKEVAAALLGEPTESLAGVLMKLSHEVEIVHRFRRGDFAPPPGIDVVMLRFRQRGPPFGCYSHEQLLRDFVVYAFTAWRPSIGHVLDDLFGRHSRAVARQAGIDPTALPSQVHLDQWLSLFDLFVRYANLDSKLRVRGAADRHRRQQDRSWKRRDPSRAQRAKLPMFQGTQGISTAARPVILSF